ncbi:MAG: carboxymuconolactone decarboxylase family protein [Rhizobacter sp.]|nr:carboxymuconolactone decarboxylase family protein [Rhizobacter sp.]
MPSHTSTQASPRYERGLRQLAAVDGDTGQAVVAALAESFPDFATYVVEFPFGDIYSRPGLGLREREIAVVAALCAMGTAGPQLRVHLHAALHVGCTPAEAVEVVMQMAVYAGFPAALNGLAAVREVFAERGIVLPLRGDTPDQPKC